MLGRAIVGVCVVFALMVCGCGLLGSNTSRELGQRLADALEGRSAVTLDNYLTPDATVYLQGGAPASRQVFQDFIDRMKTSGEVFHRMSRVYLTPNGVGWLAGITRTGVDATPSLWIEAAIQSGRITKVWVHFTIETLQSVHQPPATYIANMAAMGLPLPDGWADGTPALLAAAERYDAQADTGPKLPSAPLASVAALVGAAATVRVLIAVRSKRPKSEPAVVGERHTALLASMQEWRQTRSSPRTAIPVQGLFAATAQGETA
jgi:hypothetical protein